MLATTVQRVRSFGRQVAKSAVITVADQVRGIAGTPLASCKPLAADIVAGVCPGLDPADYKHSFAVKETIPDDGVTVPHRPIDTFHLVLDTRDPRYSCRNHVVIGPGNTVLYEDSIPFKEMSVRSRVLERPRRIGGTVGYLSNTDPGNYYHWLCFMLPLLRTYRERIGVEPDYLYIGRPIQPFHLESLALAGIGPERVLSEAVSGDRLVADFADRKRRDGAIDRSMLAFSRSLHYRAPQTRPSRRLFIGRAKSTHRRLANENACLERATCHGFEPVRMDGRSVIEQARLVAEAEMIIAPHGAALANLLFATPGAQVLELLPARPTAAVPIDAPLLTAFREIAAFVGCRYHYVMGETLPEHRHLPQSHADFSVPIDEFEAMLAAMLDAA